MLLCVEWKICLINPDFSLKTYTFIFKQVLDWSNFVLLSDLTGQTSSGWVSLFCRRVDDIYAERTTFESLHSPAVGLRSQAGQAPGCPPGHIPQWALCTPPALPRANQLSAQHSWEKNKQPRGLKVRECGVDSAASASYLVRSCDLWQKSAKCNSSFLKLKMILQHIPNTLCIEE